MMFPSSFELGRAILFMSLTGMAGLVLNQIWPQPIDALAGRLRRQQPEELSPFVPFRDVARRLYEANLNSRAGDQSRRDAGAGANVLQWWDYQLTTTGAELYGRRPPSTVLERIPPELFNRLHFDDDVTQLSDGDGTDYVDLTMTRDAAQAAIKRFSDHEPKSA